MVAVVFEGIEWNSFPRMERYWELIAVLKQWEYDPTVAKAYGWLIEGLRWRVSECNG